MVSIKTVRRFHLIVCLFKLFYFSFMLEYLYAYSKDTNKLYALPEFDQMIKVQGVHNLIIAASIGLVHEYIGLFGTRIWFLMLIYLLMHISVVPFYLYYTMFRNLWLLYVISLFSTIVYIHKLNEFIIEKRSKQKATASSTSCQ